MENQAKEWIYGLISEVSLYFFLYYVQYLSKLLNAIQDVYLCKEITVA